MLAATGGAALAGASALHLLGEGEPDWTDVTPKTEQFSIRDSARGFEHNGRLWLSGGYMVGNVPRRDLLSSEDGVKWEMVNPSTPFAAYAPVTAHDGKMIATYPKVMTSTDGVDWQEEESSGDLPPLASELPILSFNGMLVLLTGEGTYVRTGTVWKRVQNPFENRLTFSATIHNGRVFVAGGALKEPNRRTEQGYDWTSLNEVWATDDPENPNSWERLAAFAPWRERMWPGLVSHEGWLYVIGGWVNQVAQNISDVWRSRDGVAWEQLHTANLLPARHAPTVFSHQGKIILVAGNTNTGTAVQNDIWVLNA